MSSGQKAYAEEMEAQANQEHYDRLAQLGPSQILKVVDRITEHFKYLEESIPTLSRSGWYRIDEIKKELRKLA